MKKLTCVVVPIGEKPYKAEMNNDLSSIQKIVGGFFEVVRLNERLLILCDEEAKLKGKAGNRLFKNDIIAGQFVVVGDNGEDFNSLTTDEIEQALAFFSIPHIITPEEVEKTIYCHFVKL